MCRKYLNGDPIFLLLQKLAHMTMYKISKNKKFLIRGFGMVMIFLKYPKIEHFPLLGHHTRVMQMREVQIIMFF